MSGVHDRESVALAPESTHCAGVDPLSDVLDRVRLSGSLFFVVEAGAPWSAVAPAGGELRPILLPRSQQVVSYHAVIRGPVWFEMRDRPPLALESGDVVVIPHGDPYSLASDRGRAWPPLPELLAGFRELAGSRCPVGPPRGRRGARHRGVLRLPRVRRAALQSGARRAAALPPLAPAGWVVGRLVLRALDAVETAQRSSRFNGRHRPRRGRRAAAPGPSVSSRGWASCFSSKWSGVT